MKEAATARTVDRKSIVNYIGICIEVVMNMVLGVMFVNRNLFNWEGFLVSFFHPENRSQVLSYHIGIRGYLRNRQEI